MKKFVKPRLWSAPFLSENKVEGHPKKKERRIINKSFEIRRDEGTCLEPTKLPLSLFSCQTWKQIVLFTQSNGHILILAVLSFFKIKKKK